MGAPTGVAPPGAWRRQRRVSTGRSTAPGPGRAVVFRQPPGRYFYHDGEALGSGRKYLLRTDVMYRRRGPAP